MRNYEIMYILKADLDEAARNEEMEKIHGLLTANGAKINDVDTTKFGLRDLAYPIKDETKGFYVVIKVSADDQALYQFNRKTRHNPNVLRYLIVVEHE